MVPPCLCPDWPAALIQLTALRNKRARFSFDTRGRIFVLINVNRIPEKPGLRPVLMQAVPKWCSRTPVCGVFLFIWQ